MLFLSKVCFRREKKPTYFCQKMNITMETIKKYIVQFWACTPTKHVLILYKLFSFKRSL